MKKLLGILVLGLLLSSKAFAGCREDLKWSTGYLIQWCLFTDERISEEEKGMQVLAEGQ